MAGLLSTVRESTADSVAAPLDGLHSITEQAEEPGTGSAGSGKKSGCFRILKQILQMKTQVWCWLAEEHRGTE